MRDTSIPKFFLHLGNRQFKVVAMSATGVTVADDGTAPVGKGAARIAMADGPIGTTIAAVVERETVDHSGDGRAMFRVVAPANTLATLALIAQGEGKQRFRHILDLEPLPLPTRDPAGRTKTRRDRGMIAGLAALTLVFGVTIAVESYIRFLTVNADVARVTTGGEVIRAEKSGRLIYLTNRQTVQAGEPVFGVQTGSGFELASQSPLTGSVAQRLARPGDKIRPGQAVMVVTPPEARPYILVSLGIKNAVKVARGARARITYADGARETVPVGFGNVLPPGEGSADLRVLLRIETVRDLHTEVGSAVSVRFDLTGEPAQKPIDVAWMPPKVDRLW